VLRLDALKFGTAVAAGTARHGRRPLDELAEAQTELSGIPLIDEVRVLAQENAAISTRVAAREHGCDSTRTDAGRSTCTVRRVPPHGAQDCDSGKE